MACFPVRETPSPSPVFRKKNRSRFVSARMANEASMSAALVAQETKIEQLKKDLGAANKGRPKFIGEGVSFAIGIGTGAGLGATKRGMELATPSVPTILAPAVTAVGAAALGLGVKNPDARKGLFEVGKAAAAVAAHEGAYAAAAPGALNAAREKLGAV